MEKAVCYCRVSTEEEKQLNALDKQIYELEAFVQAKDDWELIETYVDEGKTGTSTKSRKSYQQLFNDLLTDKFSIIVIKDQSRLMRNVLDWYMFIDRINKNGKKLFMYLDNQYYTPDNAFITGIKAMMAEEYSRDLSKRLQSAARRSQKSGVAYGNSRIFGYTKVKGSYVIDEEEAQLVREIFDMYVQGNGIRKIVNEFAERGVLSRNGTPFAFTTIKRILKNEKYKGDLAGHKTERDFETKTVKRVDPSEYIVFENALPPIVSREIWDKCAEIREARLKKYEKNYISRMGNLELKGQYKGKYPLSNRIICGICSKPMWHGERSDVKLSRSNQGVDVSSWTCSTFRKHGLKTKNPFGCIPIRLYNRELYACLKFVISELADTNSTSCMSNVVKILASTLTEKNTVSDIEKYNKELQQINKKLDKLLDTYLDEVISKAEYNEKKTALSNRQETLQDIINEYNKTHNDNKDKSERLKEIEKIIGDIQNNPENISNELIELIVKYVIVNDRNENNRYSMEIVFDFYKRKDVTPETERIVIFNTVYPFIKKNNNVKTEEWDIIVSVV